MVRLALLAVTVVLGGAINHEPRVDRVAPPSWRSASRAQQISLLSEGQELDDATVEIDGDLPAFSRVEHGPGGKALIVEMQYPRMQKPGERAAPGKKQREGIRATLDARAGARAPAGTIRPDDVIYLIMPDRFADGDPANNEIREGTGCSTANRSTPTTAATLRVSDSGCRI